MTADAMTNGKVIEVREVWKIFGERVLEALAAIRREDLDIAAAEDPDPLRHGGRDLRVSPGAADRGHPVTTSAGIRGRLMACFGSG